MSGNARCRLNAMATATMTLRMSPGRKTVSAASAAPRPMPFNASPAMPKAWMATMPAMPAPNKPAALNRPRTASVAKAPVAAAAARKPMM